MGSRAGAAGGLPPPQGRRGSEAAPLQTPPVRLGLFRTTRVQDHACSGHACSTGLPKGQNLCFGGPIKAEARCETRRGFGSSPTEKIQLPQHYQTWGAASRLVALPHLAVTTQNLHELCALHLIFCPEAISLVNRCASARSPCVEGIYTVRRAVSLTQRG